MKILDLCVIVLIASTQVINTKTTEKRTYSKQRVVVISFDGFRHDYIKRDNLKAFKDFARYGASASSLKPVFTTKTFPNHFTIATGLYEETHGIVGNKFYDPVLKDSFSKSNDPKWWTGAKPIWMLNEERLIEGTNKTGKSATIFWPGSASSYGGKYPAYTYKEYNSSYSTKDRFNEIVKLLLDDDDLNLVMCYIEQPDNTAHNYGPDSNQTKFMLKQINNEFDFFIRKMDRARLLDNVNIIVLSDHGFLPIPRQNVKYLSDYLTNTSDFHLDSHGVLLHIRPLEGKKEQIYKTLKQVNHLQVYYKKEIPERWHYRNNRRIPEIIALSDPTYYFALSNGTWIPHGDHGYDNDLKEMHGIFIARGPAFKKNLKIGEVQNIDICALLCHVLDIEPHPNNGSLANLKHIVQEKNLFSVIMKNPALIIALLSICGIFVLVVILGCTVSCYRNFVESSKYRRLQEENVPLAQWTDDPDEITEFQLRR